MNHQTTDTESHETVAADAPRNTAITGLADNGFRLALLIAGLPLVLARFGNFFWILDLLAHFYFQYLIVLLAAFVFCLAAGRWVYTAVLGAFIAFALWFIGPYFFSIGESPVVNGPDIRLMSFNVKTSNRDFQKTLDCIREVDPDVLFLFEIDQRWKTALEDLSDDYPFRTYRTRQDNFGICVMSKRKPDRVEAIASPPRDLPCLKLAITINGESWSLTGAHPIPPMTRQNSLDRNEQMREIASRVGFSSGPRVLAGDFNVTPYSHLFGEICQRGGLRDAGLGFGIQPTWMEMIPIVTGLNIDHVLISPEISVLEHKVVYVAGSDHQAVVADLVIVDETGDR